MKRLRLELTCTVLCGCLLFSACREKPFSPEREIHVMTREDGSGTRTAFEELFGLVTVDADGKKGSLTMPEAVIARSNGVVLSGVSSDPAAIGYLSVGSLNETVRALRIDGELPTEDAIREGRYKAARPFSLVSTGDLSAAAKDFLRFLYSEEGQNTVSSAGYVRVCDGERFAGDAVTGNVVLVGSSSVSPVMEKLKEAYFLFCPDVDVEIQISDSSSGIRSAADGACDFGMTSRSLNEGEIRRGLKEHSVAMDGIAVVVHPQNTLTELTSEQVRDIYLGKAVRWQDAGAQT